MLRYGPFKKTQPIEHVWSVRVIAVACFSLAAKTVEDQAPALSKYAEHGFLYNLSTLKQAERFVFNRLKWNLRSIVTPFAYLNCFLAKFVGESPLGVNEIVWVRANELIWEIGKDVKLVDNRPSVIAAGALLAASENDLTKETMEMKTGLIPLWESQEKINDSPKCIANANPFKLENPLCPSQKEKRRIVTMINISFHKKVH